MLPSIASSDTLISRSIFDRSVTPAPLIEVPIANNYRRWCLTSKSPKHSGSVASLATSYGNHALQIDKIQKEIQSLQSNFLTECKDLLHCESGNIIYLNEKERIMVFNFGGSWYRVTVNTCIEGLCAESGRSVYCSDPLTDIRFDRCIDEVTGTHTINMLCYPIRKNRGGGKVFAVVSLVNAVSKNGFDEEDEELLAVLTQKFTDEIDCKYRDISSLIEKFSSISKLIISTKSRKRLDINSNIQHHTLSSIRRVRGDNGNIGETCGNTSDTGGRVPLATATTAATRSPYHPPRRHSANSEGLDSLSIEEVIKRMDRISNDLPHLPNNSNSKINKTHQYPLNNSPYKTEKENTLKQSVARRRWSYGEEVRRLVNEATPYDKNYMSIRGGANP